MSEISKQTIYERRLRGWSEERARSEPLQTSTPKKAVRLAADESGISVHTLRSRMRRHGINVYQAVAFGPDRVQHCSLCSKPGHYAPTCPEGT